MHTELLFFLQKIGKAKRCTANTSRNGSGDREEDAEVVKYLRAMHNIHTTRHIHCTPGTQRVAFPEDNKMMHCRLHTLKVAAFSLLTMLQDLSVGTHVITHQACGGTAIRTPLWHRSIKSSHLLQFSQPHTNEHQHLPTNPFPVQPDA